MKDVVCVFFEFEKSVRERLGGGPFLFIRFVTMPLLAFLLLLLVFKKHVARTWPKREDLPRFIACGLIGHALHVGIVFWGISLSTAFSSALVLTSRCARARAPGRSSPWRALPRPVVERYGALIAPAC